MSLAFEPGLTSRFSHLEDCVQHAVLTHRLGVDGVAAKMDMAPSELSRRLNAHLPAKEGDVSNRPLRVGDVVKIIAITGDHSPIHWLLEKFLSDPEAQRSAAINQLAMMAPVFLELAEQAGLQIPRAKVRR